MTLLKKPLGFENKQVPLTLQNTGTTALIMSKKANPKLYVSGGPLEESYEFAQFHFHWGKTASFGSECTKNDYKYSAEIHLVHWSWSSSKYKSFQDSLEHQDGFCVLGIFLQLERDQSHSPLEMLTRQLKNVEYKGQTTEIDNTLDPYTLLLRNANNYWTYPGSLTTPPLSESVIWIIFQEPIPVSLTQLKDFRELKAVAFDDKDKENVHDPMDYQRKHVGSGPPPTNFRNPMPANSRTIRSSFF